MAGASRCSAGTAAAAAGAVFVLLFSANIAGVAAQATCTTLDVTGDDIAGEFDLGTGSTYEGGSTFVLQPIAFADGEERRHLGASGRDRRGGLSGGGAKGRSLADDCTTQMWILADTAAVVNGFPYYAAFDCADHPVDVASTWMYVDCDDCAEVASVSVICSRNLGDDGGDDTFTIPVIAGISAGGVVLLLCLGACALRMKKKSPKGNHTFADDSDHDGAVKMARGAIAGGGAGAGSAPSGGAGDTAPSPTVLFGAKSFKKGHEVAETPVYNGIFASHTGSGAAAGGGGEETGGSRPGSRSASSRNPTSRPVSVEMERRSATELGGRKDSMAEAAAAAVAARAKAMGVEVPPQGGMGGILRDGVGGRQANRGGGGVGSGIKWSAGQGDHLRGFDETSDSAAGSVFSTMGPEEVTQHAYDCDESVAASSPGVNSIYSHYTAGGGVLYPAHGRGESEAWGSEEDENDDTRVKHYPLQHPSQDMSHAQTPPPPPYDEAAVNAATNAAVSAAAHVPPVSPPPAQMPRGGAAGQAGRTRSPAGLVARADRHSKRRDGETDGAPGNASRR